jgi:hypothetical protein
MGKRIKTMTNCDLSESEKWDIIEHIMTKEFYRELSDEEALELALWYFNHEKEKEE